MPMSVPMSVPLTSPVPEKSSNRVDEPFPDYHDDLAATLKFAWQMMGRGVQDRRSACHTPVLATHSADGPQARVVVLRALDVATRSLTFHTDLRSAKMSELSIDPRVALTFYDAPRKAQIRINGTVTAHAANPLSRQRWAASRPSSLRCYLGDSPGAVSATPTSGLPAHVEAREPELAELASAERYFVVLTVVVQRLEWLHLHTRGQRRASFAWPATPDSDGCSMQWLNP